MASLRFSCLWWPGVAVLTLSLSVGGCAPTPTRDGAAAEPDAPRDRIGLLDTASDEPWAAIAGERLLPLEAAATRVRVTEGPGAGRTLMQRMEPTETEGWTLTVDGRQRVHLRKGENGELLVFREDDFEQNVAVHYEPALVLVPATVAAGTVHEQTVDVTVRHLDSGGVRDRGVCKHRVEAVAAGMLEIGEPQRAGQTGQADEQSHDSHRGYLLRQTRTLNLRLANATVELDTVYVPDAGRAAWRVDRRTRALGLFGSQRRERYEWASPANATDTPGATGEEPGRPVDIEE